MLIDSERNAQEPEEVETLRPVKVFWVIIKISAT